MRASGPSLHLIALIGPGHADDESHSTVAVSCPNGSVYPIARVEGNKAYKQMMLRLSLASSQHLQ